MNKGLLNLLIDSVALLLTLGMIATGFILAFALPPGTHRTHALWGVSRHDWGAVHSWISLALLAVLTIHLALHWRWLVTGLLRRIGFAEPTAVAGRAGAILLAALASTAALGGWAIEKGVHELATPRHGLSGGESRAERRASEAGPPAEPVSGTVTSGAAARVLARRCALCHGPDTPAGGVRVSVTSLLVETEGRRWVVPGRPQDSRLFEVIGAAGAPGAIDPKHQVSPEDLAILRSWIAQLGGEDGLDHAAPPASAGQIVK